jgi:hypothetical protein
VESRIVLYFDQSKKALILNAQYLKRMALAGEIAKKPFVGLFQPLINPTRPVPLLFSHRLTGWSVWQFRCGVTKVRYTSFLSSPF